MWPSSSPSEVDVILDPLKSELNWPLGARAPSISRRRRIRPVFDGGYLICCWTPSSVRRLGRTLLPSVVVDSDDDSDEEGEDEDQALESDDDCLEADGDEVREASREKASVDDDFFGGDDEGVATRRQLAAASAPGDR